MSLSNIMNRVKKSVEFSSLPVLGTGGKVKTSALHGVSGTRSYLGSINALEPVENGTAECESCGRELHLVSIGAIAHNSRTENTRYWCKNQACVEDE